MFEVVNRHRLLYSNVLLWIAIAVCAFTLTATMGTQCAKAASGSCSVGDDEVFSANIGFDSGTAFTYTFDHSATADRTLTLPDADGSLSTFLNKTGDQTVNNSTALVSDLDLTFAVEANKNYAVWGLLLYDSHANADIDLQFTLPASATIDGVYGTASFVENAQYFKPGSGVGTPVPLAVSGVINVAGTSGNAVLEWAQTTADPTDTKMLEGSWLAYQLLN